MIMKMISVINQSHHFLRWITIILIFLNLTKGNTDLSNSISLNGTGPLIESPGDEIIFQEGETIKLRCKSDYKIFWHSMEDEHRSIANSTSIYDTNDPMRPYGLELTIDSAKTNDVGEYWCILESEQERIDSIDNMNGLKTLNQADTIYVYVNDTENQIVKPEFPFIQGILHSEFTIPCRPSMPDIQLHLYKESERVDEKFDYNPRKGFSLLAHDISDGGNYICRTTQSDTETHFHIEISPPPQSLAKPKIYADSYAHEEDNITLNCTVVVETGKPFNIVWSTPNADAAIQDNASETTDNIRIPTGHDYDLGTKILTIKNAIKERDYGTYTCNVYDMHGDHEHTSHPIKVLSKGVGTIDLREAGGKLTIEVDAPVKVVQWLIHYKGIPKTTLRWYNPDKMLIYPLGIENPKYNVQTKSNTDVMLKINNVTIDDAGDYNVTAVNLYRTESIILKLVVSDKPQVTMKNIEIMQGEEAVLHCHAKSFPRSEISWNFVPCSLEPIWPNCATVQAANTFTNSTYMIPPTKPNIESIDIRFTPNRAGVVRCRAKNSKGVGVAQAQVIIKDIVDPIEIHGIDARIPIAEGEEFKLICAISAYYSNGTYQWFFNNRPLESSSEISFTEYKTDFSYRVALVWKSISKIHQGSYTCQTQFRSNNSLIDSKTVTLTVESPVAAEFYKNELQHEEKLVSLGEPIRRECFFKGIPYPYIQWYKDGVVITNDTRISIIDENQVLEIAHIALSDEGEFKCEGINKLGTDFGTLKIKIKDLPTVGKYWIILAVLIILILLIVLIVLLIRVRRARRRLYELKSAGLANFENGCIESIDPSLSLDEQADLLPYDKKYEFPREKLTLGKQLGSGAFGVVVKGTAEGILPHEDETIVAVKTVKPNADNDVMRALISELKIMIHMGSHLNVVNLLGAVTKNIIKREVLVIVEYCRFGNVQHFMQKHRPFFVNQVNPETDEIDPSIMTIEQREQRWSNDSGFEYNSQGLKYIKLTFSNNQQPVNVRNSNNNNNNNNHDDSGKMGENRDSGSQVNSKGYTRHSKMEYFPGGMDSCNTEKSLISSSGRDDGEIMSNNSIQPAWRSNYKMDYKGPARSITTSDLVCWAFQVSRGMEYLSSRKVLHGDLAARNILLCDNNVVKICDFGLARSMYKSGNYKKKGESPLPFKWLAIESISDQIFSTYSDIWAFGIVMWEFFSLAKVPYPGMNADQQLYIKLRDGYRMDKPQYANQELYDLMLNCWNAKPESRPLFHEIEHRLGKLLQDSVKDHYVDLNEPYLQMNTEQFGEENKDYLSVLAPPTEMAPVAPQPQNHYVNSVITPGIEDPPTKPSYMSMSPRSGSVSYKPTTSDFDSPPSPTITNNLDNSPQMKASRRAKGIPEEIPMLSSNKPTNFINSDSESESSPDRKDRILENSLINEIDDSLKQTNNYINVPSLKSGGSSQSSISTKTKDAVSNPGYVTIDIAK